MQPMQRFRLTRATGQWAQQPSLGPFTRFAITAALGQGNEVIYLLMGDLLYFQITFGYHRKLF